MTYGGFYAIFQWVKTPLICSKVSLNALFIVVKVVAKIYSEVIHEKFTI